MNNQNDENLSTVHKKPITLKSFIVILLAILVIITSILSILDIISMNVWNIIAFPSLAILTLINGITTYKDNKSSGIFVLVCAAIILIAAISTLIITFTL